MADDILVWDAEVTPNVGCFWAAGRKITVLPEAIVKERQLCVIGYRWLGAKRAHVLTWGPDADEEALVRKGVELLNRARFSVAHNGDRFDLRWLRGRAMFYRVPMLPLYPTVDTLRVMKSLTYLNSHRLDYLGKYAGIGQKIKTEYDLWLRIAMENHQPSLREMAAYCLRDVDLLTGLYLEFREWFPAPPVRTIRNVVFCPYCGSERTNIHGHYITSAGSARTRLMCKACRQTYTVAASRLAVDERRRARGVME